MSMLFHLRSCGIWVLRRLALGLLLCPALIAFADEPVSKELLDAQKEFLLLKIDNGREIVQKDMEAMKSRIDAFDKRVDDHGSRVGDIGQSVDRWAIALGGILAFLGLFGYFSIAKKSADEANKASEEWFRKNQNSLLERIQELEHAASQGRLKIDSSVSDTEKYSKQAMEQMQKRINASGEKAQPISEAGEKALHQSAEELKEKPEANYSFDDWNTRAFEAYRSGKYEDAALYWKRASTVTGAGSINALQAGFNRSVALGDLKRFGEALESYGQLIDAYFDDPMLAIREQVARAMFNKGITLGQMHKPKEEVAVYEQLIATYWGDATPALREQVAGAMFNKGITLGQMQRPEEALAVYEQLISTYARDSTPALRAQVAAAMLGKGITLGKMQNLKDGVAVYEQLIATYAGDATPALREQVAKAMLNKGVILGQMQKQGEEATVYEQLIATYAGDATPALRAQVAKAMLNKGIILGQMQRLEDEVAVYEQLIAKYVSDAKPALREQVARAMLGKGITLGQLEKQEDELAIYEQLIAMYADDASPALREQVARAMLCKGISLGQMQRPEEGVAVYDQLIAAYAGDATPALQDQVARAYNGKGFQYLLKAKREWSDKGLVAELLRQAKADLLAGLELGSGDGMLRGNLAYVQWLLGDTEDARQSFSQALNDAKSAEVAEKLYRATLDDIAQHSIDEDAAFREMVDVAWSRHQAGTAG
ncbi:MAG: tetratricopeptide repeat protein [Burkholderiaceae bacterium]|jgi:tetratricopeptide (TPR) repeat protein|nr:tetratricopeptide repeat protein [Burkholderiaceae bacterium]